MRRFDRYHGTFHSAAAPSPAQPASLTVAVNRRVIAPPPVHGEPSVANTGRRVITMLDAHRMTPATFAAALQDLIADNLNGLYEGALDGDVLRDDITNVIYTIGPAVDATDLDEARSVSFSAGAPKDMLEMDPPVRERVMQALCHGEVLGSSQKGLLQVLRPRLAAPAPVSAPAEPTVK